MQNQRRAPHSIQRETSPAASAKASPASASASSDVLDAHDLLFSASGLHNREDRLLSWRAPLAIRRTTSDLKHPNHPKHEAFTTAPLANSSKISAWIFLSSAAVQLAPQLPSSLHRRLDKRQIYRMFSQGLVNTGAAGPTMHTAKL